MEPLEANCQKNRNQVKILQTPTNKLIDLYTDKFRKDERYQSADSAINQLFLRFKENKTIEEILLKTSVINSLYSTNILGTFTMAKHIMKLDIDSELKQNNPDLVSKIATGHAIRSKKNGKELNFYSFATKYCNWHNDSYPIFDSFVAKILIAYQEQNKFSEFSVEDLRNFKRFKEIISDFKK